MSDTPVDPAATKPPSGPTGITEKGLARRAERTDRRAEALRANLQRRKQQAREREDGSSSDRDEPII